MDMNKEIEPIKRFMFRPIVKTSDSLDIVCLVAYSLEEAKEKLGKHRDNYIQITADGIT